MKEYKNLLIVYYSGTGNSKRVSEWISMKAKEKGLSCYVYSYREFISNPLPEIEGETLIGFCSATHGFNLPHSFIKLILRFNILKDSDVFIVNTRAGMKLSKLFLPGLSGITQFLPAIILKLKGYRIVGMRPVDLPSNWISLHPGLKEKVVISIRERWQRKISEFTEKIFAGKRVYLPAFISLPFDMAVAPIAIGYYLAGRFMLAKTFIATDKCNNCGLCIQQCPTKSIKLIDKRPFWKLTCESCMHCMNYCPERAIETSHITVIPLCWIIFGFVNPYVAMKITGYISEYAYGFRILNEAVVFTFQVIINIGLFAMVYYVFHRMMRYDFFIRLMRYTSLTGLRFWRRYRMPG
jgi:ferredoxin